MKITINKDIREYKVKDVGPFTIKEALSLLVAIILAYGTYYFTHKYFGWVITENDIQMLLISIVVIVPLAFGFAHPYGLSLKNYLFTLLVENVISPQLRVYSSDFDWSKIEEEPDETDFLTAPKKYTKEELAEIKKWKGYK